MDEFSIGSPRDAEARRLGQDAALSFHSNPVEGDTMESFVLGDVTAEIVLLTRRMQQAQQSEAKAWRRRHFIGPILLAVTGLVISAVTTPRVDSGGSATASLIGSLVLLAGVVWFIVIAFRASGRLAQTQQVREAETGRLLEIARQAASATYSELESEGPATAQAPDALEGEPEAAPLRTVEDEEAAVQRIREARRAAGSPPPPGQPFGVTQGAAEYLVAAWMRHLGEADAATAHDSRGRGIHAASSRCVAQVNNDAESVGVDEVRELVESAAIDGRRPLFFATGSYSEEALAFAEHARAHLFTYDAVAGTLDGANALGRSAVLDGIR